MTWIRTLGVDEAEGALKAQYDAAIKRAGRVFGIVRSMSLAPSIMTASMGLYQKIMYAREGLSRKQREMLAVVVSSANNCHY